VIAFDIDGIVLDTPTAMWRAITAYLDLPWSINQWTHYDIGRIVGVPIKKLRPVYEPVLMRTDLPFVAGAESVLSAVYEKTREPLLFVTARRAQFKDSAIKSIQKGLKGIPIEVICTIEIDPDDESRNDKTDILRERGIEIFIEDNARHWNDYMDKGIKIFTLDWPWTRGPAEKLKGDDRFEMFPNWQHLGVQALGITRENLSKG